MRFVHVTINGAFRRDQWRASRDRRRARSGRQHGGLVLGNRWRESRDGRRTGNCGRHRGRGALAVPVLRAGVGAGGAIDSGGVTVAGGATDSGGVTTAVAPRPPAGSRVLAVRWQEHSRDSRGGTTPTGGSKPAGGTTSAGGTTGSGNTGSAPSGTPVGVHGQLKVVGNQIVDQNGKVIALHGMSMYAGILRERNSTMHPRLATWPRTWTARFCAFPFCPTASARRRLWSRPSSMLHRQWHLRHHRLAFRGRRSSERRSTFFVSMATAYGTRPT